MSADDRAHAQHDIGTCFRLAVETVGPPGERLFRIRARGENGAALLWLEKEELQELAHTVKRMLGSAVKRVVPPAHPTGSDSDIDFDFKVAGLALGHDGESGRYMLLAEISERDGDAIAMWADRETLDYMADQAFEVHDAGRPRCALCGSALTEGRVHACPRNN